MSGPSQLHTHGAHPGVDSGTYDRHALPAAPPAAVEFLDAGLQTTVQDYPGRVALWSVGVPPSGPMDDYSHRWAWGGRVRDLF